MSLVCGESKSCAPRTDVAGVYRRSAKYFALAEQGLISGSNLVIYLLAARMLPREDWGALSFSLAAILVLQGLQRAFVSLPMSTAGRTGEEVRRLMPLWNGVQFIVTTSAIALVGGFALLSRLGLEDWVTRSAIVAAVLIGPMFYHEYSRRVVITTGSMKRLLGMGCGYALGIFFAPAALCLLGVALSANVFVVSIAVATSAACVISGAPILLMRGRDFGLKWGGRDIIRFGSWAAASSIAYSGYNFAVQAILAVFAGPAALGVFAAVRTLTQPVGTVIQAIDSVDKPRAGRAFAERGISGLWGVIRRSWIWLIALSLPYLAGISTFSNDVLALVYGDRYADASGLVVLWSIVMMVMIITQPLETGLYVVRRPDHLFMGRAVTAVLVLSITPYLVSRWTASGALAALILGWLLAGVFAAVQLHVRGGGQRQ